LDFLSKKWRYIWQWRWSQKRWSSLSSKFVLQEIPFDKKQAAMVHRGILHVSRPKHVLFKCCKSQL